MRQLEAKAWQKWEQEQVRVGRADLDRIVRLAQDLRGNACEAMAPALKLCSPAAHRFLARI